METLPYVSQPKIPWNKGKLLVKLQVSDVMHGTQILNQFLHFSKQMLSLIASNDRELW